MVNTDEKRERDFKLVVERGKPINFDGLMPDDDTSSPGAEDARRIVRALKSYRETIHEVVTSRYREIADSLPRHFRQRANVFIVRCRDGLLVRYEATDDERPWYQCGSIDQPLEALAPVFTDGFVYIPSNVEGFVPPSDVGPRITMAKLDAAGGTEELCTLRPFVVGDLAAPPTQRPGSRPIPIVFATNEIELQVGGVVMSEATTPREFAHKEDFVGRGQGALRVGWQAIEVYAPIPIEAWNESLAPAWAERDVLAEIAHANILDQSFSRLDGRREARRRYVELIREFESLLAGPEEPVHQFLKKNRELIAPTSIRHWSKLPFGAHVSDFVFLESHNDYVLVEIEAPHRELFRQDGHPRHELNHAIGQVRDWIQHIEDNKAAVERTLPGISTSPRALVVIGRSAALTTENRRKLSTLTNRHSNLRIMTYDDLLANTRSMLELLFGPLDIESNMQLYFFNRTPV